MQHYILFFILLPFSHHTELDPAYRNFNSAYSHNHHSANNCTSYNSFNFNKNIKYFENNLTPTNINNQNFYNALNSNSSQDTPPPPPPPPKIVYKNSLLYPKKYNKETKNSENTNNKLNSSFKNPSDFNAYSNNNTNNNNENSNSKSDITNTSTNTSNANLVYNNNLKFSNNSDHFGHLGISQGNVSTNAPPPTWTPASNNTPTKPLTLTERLKFEFGVESEGLIFLASYYSSVDFNLKILFSHCLNTLK